ncbi:MAG: NAD(P)/FAD-dependent oxidoreductase [Saprospiraceae bacterium]
MSNTIPILIIGAGPAGLAIAGRLRKKGLDFEMIEKSDHIAASWHGHYDRLHLHTVKQLSHLPHLPFPDDYPLYVPRLDLLQYYEDYAHQFDIRPHFNHAVANVSKENGRWKIRCTNGKVFTAEQVVVATGANHIPQRPHWAGEKEYHGMLMHSREYKNTEPFTGKKVLIIGMGNTGAEIALDLAEHDIDTTISVRSPVTIVPRDVFGNPVQLTAKKLEKIPFGIGDWLGTVIRKIVIGDLTKYGVPLSKVHPAVQLKETGKTPLIDLGTVAHIKSGKIKIVGDLDHFNATGVQLKSGESLDVDAVILATGYHPQLEDLIDNVAVELDRFRFPKGPIATAPENQGLYFVGFDNYKLGGILGTIYEDSGVVAQDIAIARRSESEK